MIFVTAGAYDLPFDRLSAGADAVAALEGLDEPIFAQIGHSQEPAGNVTFERFLPFDRMNELADEARIIIAQGGPGTIMLALGRGKVPIVMPRQEQFGEMVDNHQVLFAEKLASEGKILLVMDVADLPDAVLNYDDRIAGMNVSAQAIKEKAEAFAGRLEDLIVSYQARKKGA